MGRSSLCHLKMECITKPYIVPTTNLVFAFWFQIKRVKKTHIQERHAFCAEPKRQSEWASERTPFKWNVCVEKFLPYILFLVVVFRFNHSILPSPRVFCYRIDLFASLSTFSTAKTRLKSIPFYILIFFCLHRICCEPEKKLYHSRIIEL